MDVRGKLVELLADHCDMKDKGCIGCEKGLPAAIECKEVRFGRVADHLIAHGVTVQEWISAKDEPPDDNERVIAYRPNEPETSAYKYCVMWGWSVKASLKHRGITHWCAMPQPPQDREGGNQ